MKLTPKFTIALVIASLITGWLIATISKPANATAAAVEPPAQSIGRYQFINPTQPGMGLYVFETTQGKLYQFSMDPNGAPHWQKLGSPDDAK